MGRLLRRAVNATKLERWLGAQTVSRLSVLMREWYGPPIRVSGIPGPGVWAYGGGDFRGQIEGGLFSSAADMAERVIRRFGRGTRHVLRSAPTQMNTGFTSIGDLLAEATAGKMKSYAFYKIGTTGVATSASSLWRAGALPQAGAAPAAAAAGTAFSSSSTGAFSLINAGGGDTLHFVSAFPLGSVLGNTLLLYDLIFGVAKTMNSQATEAVSGVPTRYQSTTASDENYAGGNFLFVQAGGTQLANTAHNWTTCLYTDQAGAGSTLPSLTGNAQCIVDRYDQPANQWFAPLEAGDVGIQTLTQMQCSASVATGVVWFMIGHPIAWLPCPIANVMVPVDGIQSGSQPTRIFDNACLAFIEAPKPSVTATTYTGSFNLVSG